MSIRDSGSYPFYLLLILLVKTKQHIRKQRHYFADKSPYIPSYGFSSSHEQMWNLDYKEGWVPKNWCFWIVVLKKTLESLLDSKEIKPVNPKGNQHWILIRRIDAEAEGPLVWPPDVKRQLIGKDPDAGKEWGQEENRATEDGIVGWHQQLNRPEFKQTLGDRKGQGSLVCCNPWGHKESDMT